MQICQICGRKIDSGSSCPKFSLCEECRAYGLPSSPPPYEYEKIVDNALQHLREAVTAMTEALEKVKQIVESLDKERVAK